MKMHCPHCGVKGSVDDSYIGRKVRCPKCQNVFHCEDEQQLIESPALSESLENPDESSVAAIGKADPGQDAPGSREELPLAEMASPAEEQAPDGEPESWSTLAEAADEQRDGERGWKPLRMKP